MAQMLCATYEYHGDTIVAMFEGREIARGTEFAKVACDADEYFNSLAGARKHEEHEAARRTATHIETPNGLRGEILSRVAGVWGEEITVRFDNGQIRRFETAAGDEVLKYAMYQPEGAMITPAEALKKRLASEYDPNRAGLTARLAELDDMRQTARHLIASEGSLTEQKALHMLVLAAEAEGAEIKESLAHLDAVDAENATLAPPTYAAVEQADLGHAARDNWLDVVAHEMIAESEGQDFDKLLQEGPTVLVSSLGDAAVHDAGTVREAALAHVVSKTAGFRGEKVDEFRQSFIEATEVARRQELKYRQKETEKTVKQASAMVDESPDEALFI